MRVGSPFVLPSLLFLSQGSNCIWGESGTVDIGDCSLDCSWRSCCAAVPLQKAGHGQTTWASAENMEDL